MDVHRKLLGTCQHKSYNFLTRSYFDTVGVRCKELGKTKEEVWELLQSRGLWVKYGTTHTGSPNFRPNIRCIRELAVIRSFVEQS